MMELQILKFRLSDLLNWLEEMEGKVEEQEMDEALDKIIHIKQLIRILESEQS